MELKDDERLGKISGHVSSILKLIGWTPERDPELAETPRRVAEFYLGQMASADLARPPHISLIQGSGVGEEMVVVRGVAFHSMCAHHLLPFFGKAHLGYVPDGRIAGLGSLGRLVDYFSGRPQLQERLTQQLAAHVMEALRPRGVIVLLEARHLCLEMRGSHRRARLDTIATLGCFAGGALRGEFLNRVHNHSTR